MAPSSRSSHSGAPIASRTAWAWLLFAPPAAVVGLRQVLQWQTERSATMPVLTLSPFAGAQDPWFWLPLLGWAVLGVAVASVLARALHRRWGTRALQRTLGAAADRKPGLTRSSSKGVLRRGRSHGIRAGPDGDIGCQRLLQGCLVGLISQGFNREGRQCQRARTLAGGGSTKAAMLAARPQ